MSEPVEIGEPRTARDAIVGNSRAMQSIYKEIGRLADKPVTVLIRGETGTGKELVARALYQHSDRAKRLSSWSIASPSPRRCWKANCSGTNKARSPARRRAASDGFEQANHGTIFLDEIGDMTMSTQAKLLRVLQEKTIQRLGGKETIPVDVRILAATHRDLEAAIRENQFREDLYYRLNVAVVTLPPLREHKEDIPDLVRFFLQKYAAEFNVENPSIHPDAVEFLQAQPWSGNVRELENTTRKMLLLAQSYTISIEHVRAALTKTNLSASSAEKSLQVCADELLAAAQRGELTDAHARLHETVERVLISRAMELTRGNQSKAASWLGISRMTLREKMVQFGLHSN